MNIINNGNQKVLVYDIGTSAIKFGYGGDIKPLFSIPPYSGQRYFEDEFQIKFGEEWLQKHLPGFEVLPMFDQDGNIMDREMIMPFLDWTYTTCFGDLDPQEWNVLFSQPSFLLLQPDRFSSRRSLFSELSFEFANHPQISFQHDAALACYSQEIHTGVVVDFGWSYLRIVPVLEGHPLRKGIRLLKLGGYDMTQVLFKNMEENGKAVRTFLEPKTSYTLGDFDTQQGVIMPTPSQVNFCQRGVLIDMIKNVLHFGKGANEADEKSSFKDYIYFMPGHEPVDIKNEIQVLADFFWQNSDEQQSLQTMIADSINSLPLELHDRMWSSIVPCGGLSQLRGFNKMLERQLSLIAPPGIKPKLVLPKFDETKGAFSIWVGGSIVASYEKFDELCITKDEWHDFGPKILDMKCL